MRPKTKIALLATSLASLAAGTFASATYAHFAIISKGRITTNSIVVKARDSSMEMTITPNENVSPMLFEKNGRDYTCTSEDLSVTTVSSEYGYRVFYKKDEARLQQGDLPYANVTNQAGYYLSYYLTIDTKAEAEDKNLSFRAHINVDGQTEHLDLNDVIRIGIVEVDPDTKSEVDEGFKMVWGNLLLTGRTTITHVSGIESQYVRAHSRVSDEIVSDDCLLYEAGTDNSKTFKVSIWCEGVSNYNQENIRGLSFSAWLEASMENPSALPHD